LTGSGCDRVSDTLRDLGTRLSGLAGAITANIETQTDTVTVDL